MRYEIKGGSLPVAIIKLNRGERILTQSGGMSWHTGGISVQTKGMGGIGKMIKRSLSGESMFQNIYQADEDNQEIALASTFPGDILPFDVGKSESLIVQSKSFLASDVGVKSDIFFQKRIGSGLFGGEGFIMLKLTGEGFAFLEVDGSVHEYMLRAGEKMIVDTGHMIAMEETCTMSIEKAGNIKSMFLGGEGAFNTVIAGPGKLYLQSMPLNRLQALIAPNTGSTSGS